VNDDSDEGSPMIVRVVRPGLADRQVLELEAVDVTGDLLACPLWIDGADLL